jgi:Uma2 family endonuclease
MSALAQSRTRMTPEEFFTWENEQPERHEFIDGEIHAMTGATMFHNEITFNLNAALRARLKGRGCHVFQEGVKVQVGADFFYPDVIVQCRPRDGTSYIATHPVLLAEVFSKTTKHYDQTAKWSFYQRIPSLHTFLLIAQDALMVHLYRRRGAEWLYTSHGNLADLLELSEPALTLPRPRALRGHRRHRPRAARVLTRPQLLRPICPPCAVHFQCPTNTYSRLHVAT